MEFDSFEQGATCDLDSGSHVIEFLFIVWNEMLQTFHRNSDGKAPVKSATEWEE